jgi:L-2-amino-thiazoline-4-carboxylic acid hydrolase
MSSAATDLHMALQEANEARGHLYLAFLRVLERRFGRDAAIAAMREALRDWGRHLGQGLARHAPGDFDGLARDFVHAPDAGRMFQPAVHRCDSSGIDTQMMRCPLKQAWQAAGVADADIALLCSVASEADLGTMEAAGFRLDIETWQPGGTGCCVLRIRRG